jgi:hypothetical protein
MSKKKPADFVTMDGAAAHVELSREYTFDGIKHNRVTMREPTVGDIEDYNRRQGSDTQKEIDTFANLCSLTPDNIRAMSLRDYTRLQEAYRLFMD